MDLMEYKARDLYQKYQINTPNGVVVESPDELPAKAAGLAFPLVVKAQVQTGGRGKAGGIKFAKNEDELVEAAKNILGMNIKGHVVKKLLIVEKAEISKECYLAVMLDRMAKRPMVIFSPEGGVDIEETAKKSPEKIFKVPIDPVIGVRDYIARYILGKSGLGMELHDKMHDLLNKLYKMFSEYDCTLVEINPLGITENGELVALDGKVSVDDSALYRQPEILEFRDSIEEHELVVEARKFRFLYIPCDGDGNIAVMSNGSGMLMSCIDIITRQGMKVGAVLDLGGGATADRIKEAIRILLSDSKIDALFINIFGGITRCDEVASGIKAAQENIARDKLVVVRFEGTNKDKGLEILKTVEGNAVFADNLIDGVKILQERMEKQ
jgi:succinyl-CoA synthetase beta subunit